MMSHDRSGGSACRVASMDAGGKGSRVTWWVPCARILAQFRETARSTRVSGEGSGAGVRWLELLEKCKSLFDGTLGKWKGEKCHIELKENAKPFHA